MYLRLKTNIYLLFQVLIGPNHKGTAAMNKDIYENLINKLGIRFL